MTETTRQFKINATVKGHSTNLASTLAALNFIIGRIALGNKKLPSSI